MFLALKRLIKLGGNQAPVAPSAIRCPKAACAIWKKERPSQSQAYSIEADGTDRTVRQKQVTTSALQSIPSDLRTYLSSHPGEVLHLNTEMSETLNVQRVQLVSLPELRFADIPIDTYEYHLNHKEFDEDPKLHYSFRAVNIIAKELDDRFDSNGLLLWFPDFQRYGAWDDTHYIIYTFPTATWADIIASPSGYINAQWNPVKGEHELLMPWRDQGIAVEMEQFRIKTSG